MTAPPVDDHLEPAFYAAMREEMLRRLDLRDRLTTFVFTLSLAGAGAAAGLAARLTTGQSFGTSPLVFALVTLLVPLASTASAFLYIQHSRQIAWIARYLESECQKYVARRSPDGSSSGWLPWELSAEIRSARAREYKWRAAGEVCFVAGPAVIVLVVFAPWTAFPAMMATWIIGCVLAVVAVSLVLHRWAWHETVHQ